MLLIIHGMSLCGLHDSGLSFGATHYLELVFKAIYGFLVNMVYSLPYSMHLGVHANIGGCDELSLGLDDVYYINSFGICVLGPTSKVLHVTLLLTWEDVH